KSDEPGGLTEDGGSMCVRRAKKSSCDNPYIEVHAGLKQALKAHKAWQRKRYPGSPWYFPGFDKPMEGPVNKSALTKALARLFANSERNKKVSDPKKRLPELRKKFTSHGARAFYVFVRRSQGATDSQIAFEI